MTAVSLPADFWTLILVVGIVAMLATTVAMIAGLTPGKKPPKPEAMSPLRIVTANAARERASAAASAKAAAAARERRLQLTDVRQVPAGQTTVATNRQPEQPAVTPEEAEAMLAHYAENDPSRLAEVIIQWIKSDVNNADSGSSERNRARPRS